MIGFPLGATSSETKAFETETAIKQGATEIDMVINIGALKARDLETVAKDIRGVVMMAHSHGAIVKVIIETTLLTDEEKTLASLISKEGRCRLCQDIHRVCGWRRDHPRCRADAQSGRSPNGCQGLGRCPHV